PMRPKRTSTRTGAMTVPKAPNGSRRKTFSSIQISRPSPCIVSLIPDGVARHLDEYVLEVGQNCAEVGHVNAVLGQAPDYGGYQIFAFAANRESFTLRR